MKSCLDAAVPVFAVQTCTNVSAIALPFSSLLPSCKDRQVVFQLALDSTVPFSYGLNEDPQPHEV